MFVKVYSLGIVLLFIIGCAPPVIEEDFRDSYTATPTVGKLGSISFTFAGKAVGVDNYAVYYSKTMLDDPLTAPPTAVTLNTYTTDESLKLQINKLQEGQIYYVWVYAKNGAEIIQSLPVQTVYAYTKIMNYQLVNAGGSVEATWFAVSGADTYSVFKEEAGSNSLLAKDISEADFLLENKLNDKDSSYVVAYDKDGDILAESSSAIYASGISLSLNITAGIFPGTVRLRWAEDIGATSYDIVYSEVGENDIPISTETIMTIASSAGIAGTDPLKPSVRTISYLVENLTGSSYVYQVKGKKTGGRYSQFSSIVIAETAKALVLKPFTTVNSSIPYEMGMTWNGEYTTVRDLNGKSLKDLYSDLKYELIFTRPEDAPSGAGSKFVYSDPSNSLSYANTTYSVAVNDSANLGVYKRDALGGVTVGDYAVEVKLLGRNKTTLDNITLGSYTATATPNPIQRYALDAEFDGAMELTLNAPTATSSLKNYYRIKETNVYTDIPLLADLESLPATNTLDLSSPSLSAVASKPLVQYEVWTTLNDVYVSFGAGSVNTTPLVDLALSAVPDNLPGSIYISWNESYERDKSGYDLEIKRTGSTAWTSLATDIPYSTTDANYTVYDLDLIDEANRNAPINYDLRLTPNTETSDQATVHSIFPRAELILQVPTQLNKPAEFTPFQLVVPDQYISPTGVETIKDIENRDGTKFNSHFTGSLAPKVRLTITRPDFRPSGVDATFVDEFPFNYSSIDREINDADNASYVSVRGGRAYAGAYSVKYQLIANSGTPEEQILGESEEVDNVEGGYLNPSYIGDKVGTDRIDMTNEADAKYRPRTFTKLATNSANYQLIYFTDTSGHSVVPDQPDAGSIRNSRQIYKLGDGFGNSAFDLRRYEGSGGSYYIQIYTYRTSDDLLIGSKQRVFNSAFVLQPMFWYSSALNAGGTPYLHWFMPYLRDTSGGNDTYYFTDGGGFVAATSTSHYGTIPINWFTGFSIYAGLTDNAGSVLYSEELLVPNSDSFTALLHFYRAYSFLPSFTGSPSLYFYNPGTGTRFGKGVGNPSILGHYLGYDGSTPPGYSAQYGSY